MAKRKWDEEESVVMNVHGFNSAWSFNPGTKVDEVKSLVSMQFSVPFMEISIVQDGLVAPATMQSCESLKPGLKYRVERSCPRRKSFALGTIVRPSVNFHVNALPAIAEVASMLSQGKYCVLCGPRQSGKTTAAQAVRQRLSAIVVYLDGLFFRKDWSESKFWGYLWDSLHAKCPQFFRARRVQDEYTDLSFRMLFLKTASQMVPVTLILDRAESLLGASAECLGRFFSTLRNMRRRMGDYNLKGLLLVGIETVKDLLESRRCNDGCSMITREPFPDEYLAECQGFTRQEVKRLLIQAAGELVPAAAQRFEVARLAEAVVAFTGGHKGLVVVVLDRVVAHEFFKTQDLWSHHSDLGAYAFSRAGYKRALERFKQRSSDLLQFLQTSGLHCDAGKVAEFRELIADGVLAARESPQQDHGGRKYNLRISSPLLRSLILRRCVIKRQGTITGPAPDPRVRLAREWLIIQTIKALDGATMCGDEISQYSREFAFFARIKAVLAEAYPLANAIVLAHTKVSKDGLALLDEEDCLEIQVRYGFEKFGFVLAVEGDDDLQAMAQRYHKKHGCQVYVISFRDQPLLITPVKESVIFVSVRFCATSAEMTFKDSQGTETKVDNLALEKWGGEFSFDDLV
ncbi:hypothetical protein SELMODRAFT_427301 [Selaginella moellendorffii]|uniref:Uncharacterized protein n=1 Tax=Selaginella moellendorffii TaxID=88036 RepID=D8SZ63_SELML|nr:hypothetical protein SELMODRAFT_427301 [Selaginella moellendorffii]